MTRGLEVYDKLTVGLLLFLIAMLVWGKVERHWVSLAVLVALLLSGAITLSDTLEYVDWDVLGLILGVAVLTAHLERSGVTYRVASTVVRLSGGSAFKFVFLMALISGAISLFMENVSVVILLYPVLIFASRLLGIQPTIPAIIMALSANISGSATMIGDPPAIITAGAFKLGFTDFIVYHGKPSMFFFTITSMVSAILVSTSLNYRRVKREKTSALTVDPLDQPVDNTYMAEALLALTLKIVLLSLRHQLGIPLSLTAAVSVALLTVTRIARGDRASVTAAFKQGFEWKLLLFLVGVFALSGSFEKHNLASRLARALVDFTGGNAVLLTSALMYACVALSSVIDNVPITVTMLPIVIEVSRIMGLDPVVIMWSVLIGITLGGNLTYIGASANVTVVRLLEKSGYRVSFTDFIRISVVYNTVSILIAWVFYVLTYF